MQSSAARVRLCFKFRYNDGLTVNAGKLIFILSFAITMDLVMWQSYAIDQSVSEGWEQYYSLVQLIKNGTIHINSGKQRKCIVYLNTVAYCVNIT